MRERHDWGFLFFTFNFFIYIFGFVKVKESGRVEACEILFIRAIYLSIDILNVSDLRVVNFLLLII